jgi:hypothetical protein
MNGCSRMSDQNDVREIALALPEVEEGQDRFAFSIGKKGFAWIWQERVQAKKPRVANAGVLAVRVANLEEKELMLSLNQEKFFTEPHYNGFPAVLIRLEKISRADLEPILQAAWRCQAPRALLRRWEG